MFKHSSSDRSRIVKGVLEGMPASNRVLHSLRSPSIGASIDHIVVSPCGIFAIDVVRVKGTIKARKDTLFLGDRDLIGACISTQKKAGEVGKYMRHTVAPVLCFVDAKLPAPVIHLRHVVVCTPDILRQYINGGPRCLDARSVELFADRAAALGRERSTAAISSVSFPPPGTAPLRGPALLPRLAPRPRRPAPTPAPTQVATTSPRHRRFFGHQIIGTAIGTAVCILGAWAVPVLAHLADSGVDQSVQAIDHSSSRRALTEPSITTVAPEVVAPEVVAPAVVATEDTAGTAVPAAETSTPAVETTVPAAQTSEAAPGQPELLPTLDFTCPAPGEGWTASPVATLFQSDPAGYHLWHRISPGVWGYWGLFKSGIEAPPALTGLASGEALDVRMDRSFHPNAEGAPTMLTFTAPDEPC
jgi:hypothetical protein